MPVSPLPVIAIGFAAFAPFVIANEQSERGNPPLHTLVIAKVRVSGGHLCKAEAPTEPAGEICKRLWQSVLF